ncbi:MAG: LysE family translocator [Gammaproteobacteria bacterium]
MPRWETVLLVLAAGLALSASPGPSMLYVLSRSVGQSRAAGFASAIGLALGGVALAIAGALGLAAVFIHSPILYGVVKFGGALYLLYLGVQMIWTKDGGGEGEVKAVKQLGFFEICYQGFVVELLNPKTLLFFVAFLPQFIETERGSVTLQMLILGMLVPLTAVPSDIIVALTGGTLARQFTRNRKLRRGLEWLGGLFLIGLGLRIFFDAGPNAGG